MNIPSFFGPFVFAILTIIFAVSIFTNIAYPLLWQDEAETVIAGERILTYGYPKSHDGKNMLYLIELADKSLGIKEPFDAYIGPGWTQFYVAAIGVKIAEHVTDIYQKTALLRIPFGIIGLLGILICAQVANGIFHAKTKWLFLCSYLLLCMLSISLTLHIREVRYYALIIFLSGVTLWLYTTCRKNLTTFSRQKYALYTFTLVILLNLTLLTFPPLFFILVTTLGISILRNSSIRLHIIPLVIAVIFSIPLFILLEIIPFVSAMNAYFNFGTVAYVNNLVRTFHFLFVYEFFALVLLFKVAQLILKRVTSKRDQSPQLIEISKLSNFLCVYFVIYVLFIARTPYLFERYLMALIPFINLMLLLDLFYSAIVIQKIASKKLRSDVLFVTMPTFLAVVAISLIPKLPHISGHLYELTHQYKGPVDYAVEYINDTFPDPSQLVIATNYEELSYAYYLGSKVTIGYVGNNLLEDSTVQPDIIIMRKNRNNFLETFQMLLLQDSYTAVHFDIDDYDFNNIPELYLAKPHRFKTVLTSDPHNQLTLYVRDSIMGN